MNATSSTLGGVGHGFAEGERPSGVRADDADVRELLRAGAKETASRLLMSRHGAAVHRYCCGALRDGALAEAVLEEVFVEAHREVQRLADRLDTHRPDTRSRVWIFGIARRRVLRALASRGRLAGRAPEPGAARSVSPGPTRAGGDDRAGAPHGPTECGRIDDEQLRSALAACLEQVGEHLRTALLLRYQQGFSFDEMAEICGETPRTLRERVAAALPLLRRCIEQRTGGTV